MRVAPARIGPTLDRIEQNPERAIGAIDEGALRSLGGSHVVGPWGRVVADALQVEEAPLLADIDLTSFRAHRRDIPPVEDARLGLVERDVRRLVAQGGGL